MQSWFRPFGVQYSILSLSVSLSSHGLQTQPVGNRPPETSLCRCSLESSRTTFSLNTAITGWLASASFTRDNGITSGEVFEWSLSASAAPPPHGGYDYDPTPCIEIGLFGTLYMARI